MVRSVCLLFLTAMTAVSGNSFAAVIQQVGYNCGESACNDGCNGSEKRSKQCNCDSCQPYDSGRQRCGMRSTWNDFGTNWTGNCGPIGRAARWGVPGARCVKHCMDTKGSGDSGWSPPARMPVNRTHTGFGSYASYGAGYGGAPMVYQPTDTAQLGYSYAHVPTWRPNPNMIPQTPIPSNFHARFCPQDLRGGVCVNNGYMMMDSGMIINDGMMMEGEVIGGEYCPACVSTPTARSATEAVVRMNQVRQPNSTVAITKTPLPATASNVENNIRLTAQTLSPTPPPQVQMPAEQRSQPQVQMPQQQIQLPPQQWTQQQVQMPQTQPRQNTNSQPQRQTTQRRPQQQKSGGWFGLPSLSEVKF